MLKREEDLRFSYFSVLEYIPHSPQILYLLGIFPTFRIQNLKSYLLGIFLDFRMQNLKTNLNFTLPNVLYLFRILYAFRIEIS